MAAVICLSFLITAHFFESHDRTDRVHALADRITIELLATRLAEKAFVRDDLHSDAFYASGTSDALTDHGRHLANLRKDIPVLIALTHGPTRFKVETLSAMVAEYAALFAKMAAHYRELGFKDWGVLGELRRAIHTVEHIVLDMNAVELHESLLQLRRIEKDYLLRGDAEYIDTLWVQLDTLKRRIAGIGTQAAAQATDALLQYERAFKDYLRLERVIGRSSREGLQMECVRTVRKTEPVIRHVLSEVQNAKQRAKINFLSVSIAVYLTGFGIAGLVLYRFSHTIAFRLGELKRAALSVGRGHLETRVPIGAMDEIGIVAGAFNKMASDLHQIAELRMISARTLDAQENERKRVARELHDGIGQALTGIKYCLENGLRKLRGGAAVSTVRELDDAIGMLRETVEETRRISMGLRPSTLDDIGIAETVFWFCGQFEEIYRDIRIAPEVDVDEERLPDALKTAIFRIIQEAMNNVAKHSHARRVTLSLRQEEDRVRLAVTDDGTGFVANRLPDGFGLASMKERTELCGGRFTLTSRPGRGTTVAARWPLDPDGKSAGQPLFHGERREGGGTV